MLFSTLLEERLTSETIRSFSLDQALRAANLRAMNAASGTTLDIALTGGAVLSAIDTTSSSSSSAPTRRKKAPSPAEPSPKSPHIPSLPSRLPKGKTEVVTLINTAGQPSYPRYRIEQDRSTITLNERHFVPGFYTLAHTTRDTASRALRTVTQPFAWGVLAMNADQDHYAENDIAHLDFGVLDDRGEIVCDATLTLRVTGPDGSIQVYTTADGSIRVTNTCGLKEAGLIMPDYATDLPLPLLGNYALDLTAMRPGAASHAESSIHAVLPVVSSAPFTVRRTAATRLWPLAPSTMAIEVSFSEAFSGTIMDIVPEGFSILQSSPAATVSLLPPEQDSVLVWHGSWLKGQRALFSYTYNAPDISPAFYLIGPLRLVSHNGDYAEELRQWQIANDLTSVSSGYQIVGDVLAAGGMEDAKSINYVLDDTVGETVVGPGSTDHYTLNAGYRVSAASSHVGLGCSASVPLPSIVVTGQVTGTGSCTVTTDSAAGYALSFGVLSGSGGQSTGSLISPRGYVIRPYLMSGGLIGHWRLDETSAGSSVVDRSGNANTGTPGGTGGTNNLPQPSSLRPGGTNFSDLRSLSFDGSDDVITVPHASSLDVTSAYTLALWIHPSASQTVNPLVVRGEGSTDDIELLLAGGTSGLTLAHNRGNGGTFATASHNGHTGCAADGGWGEPSVNTWTHVVVTFESGTWKVYYNGVQQGSSVTGCTGPDDTNKGWMLGHITHSDFAGGTTSFAGLLNDVRFFGRSLSASEVLALYGTPQTWSIAADEASWGGRLSSLSTDTDLQWGEDGMASQWLGIGDGTYPIVSRSSKTATGGSLEVFQYRAEAGAATELPPGTYQTTVTYTASAL